MVLARFDVIFSSRMRSMALPCSVSRVSLDSLLLKELKIILGGILLPPLEFGDTYTRHCQF
ncbi:hypothetical protein AAC387_Pa09g1747 [Persea americana]